MNVLTALVLAGGLAVAGAVLKWLTPLGAVAAASVGTVILTGLGPPGAILLGMFFVSGSVLTRVAERKGVASPDAKGGRRDHAQVMANGGWAAAGALLATAESTHGWAFALGALAAAQADTWATEIGAYATRPPRLITTFQPVPRGTSGGVTGVGTLGGVAGAAVMAGTAHALGIHGIVGAGFVGGLAGMLCDSLLGAGLQARFYCVSCAVPTEQSFHSCGQSTRLEHGFRWLNNDVVNVIATGIGGAVAVLGATWT